MVLYGVFVVEGVCWFGGVLIVEGSLLGVFILTTIFVFNDVGLFTRDTSAMGITAATRLGTVRVTSR